jgi:hypothetical protein
VARSELRSANREGNRARIDAGGAPPNIPDPRVTWHVGRLEETLPSVTIDFESPLCVLFDLDLYEPSAFALERLEGELKPGDLLYFDEAYDPWQERRLIDEILDCGQRFSCTRLDGNRAHTGVPGRPVTRPHAPSWPRT